MRSSCWTSSSSLSLGDSGLLVGNVDRASERDQPRLLHRLRERGMRGHAVGDCLHGCLGVERDDACLDQVGDVRPHHHDAEQLPVARLVDGLHPTRRLVLHERASDRRERERACDDVIAVLLAGLALGQTDRCDLGIRVDRARNSPVVDDGVVTDRVLRGDLALAESGVGELPVAGAVTDGVDMADCRAAVFVGGDALLLVEIDADLLEAEVVDERTAAGCDEHEVAFLLLAAVVNDESAVALLDLVALGLEVDLDAPLLELLGELLGRVVVLLRDERRKHLDDRHLAAKAPEDRGELASDDASAEDEEPFGHLGLREEARRVDAAVGIDALDWRSQWVRAGGDDRLLEGHVLLALDGDRVGVLEASRSLHPLDAVRLEEARNPGRELLDDARLPLVRGCEVELRLADLYPELGERLFGLLERVSGLHPGLRRDASDPQARAPELRFALDADGLCPELGGADRRRVTARTAAENGDVTFHFLALSLGSLVTAILPSEACLGA